MATAIKEKRHYIKHKRNQTDYCNICGRYTSLTWDHVPPKSLLIDPDVYANTIVKSMPSEENYMRHYQNGIKYRTLCSSCNNVLLGKNDAEYKKFVSDVVNELSRIDGQVLKGEQPDTMIIVKTKINRVLRALCGHILAMRDQYDNKVIPDVEMREYVKDESLLCNKPKIYGWLYPYTTIINARDCVVKGKNEFTHPHGMISVMSAFPIAIIQSTDDEIDCGLDDLSLYSTNNIEDEVEVSLHMDTLYLKGTKHLKHFTWPLDVGDKNSDAMFVLGSNEMMNGSRLAVPRELLLNGLHER